MRLRQIRLILAMGLGTLLIGLIGCEGAHRIKVETAYGPGARIGGKGYTYNWAKDIPAMGDVHSANPQVHEFVRSLVEQNLAAKGYVKKTDGTPDGWLDYGFKREVRGEPYGDTAFPQYAKGSIVLYVINPESNQWAWRGWAQARLDEAATPTDREARLTEAINKLLADIPPAHAR